MRTVAHILRHAKGARHGPPGSVALQSDLEWLLSIVHTVSVRAKSSQSSARMGGEACTWCAPGDPGALAAPV